MSSGLKEESSRLILQNEQGPYQRSSRYIYVANDISGQENSSMWWATNLPRRHQCWRLARGCWIQRRSTYVQEAARRLMKPSWWNAGSTSRRCTTSPSARGPSKMMTAQQLRQERLPCGRDPQVLAHCCDKVLWFTSRSSHCCSFHGFFQMTSPFWRPKTQIAGWAGFPIQIAPLSACRKWPMTVSHQECSADESKPLYMARLPPFAQGDSPLRLTFSLFSFLQLPTRGSRSPLARCLGMSVSQVRGESHVQFRNGWLDESQDKPVWVQHALYLGETAKGGRYPIGWYFDRRVCIGYDL